MDISQSDLYPTGYFFFYFEFPTKNLMFDNLTSKPEGFETLNGLDLQVLIIEIFFDQNYRLPTA